MKNVNLLTPRNILVSHEPYQLLLLNTEKIPFFNVRPIKING